MPYKEANNITIPKELRAELVKLKEKYGVTWAELFNRVLELDKMEDAA